MTAPVNNPNAPTAPPTTNYNDLALTLSKQYREASKQPKHSFGGFPNSGIYQSGPNPLPFSGKYK